MNESLKRIISSIENINGINQQIAVSAEQQSCVADEMNRNIIDVSQQTEKTMSNATTTLEQSISIKKMADQLSTRLHEYKV